ncbi:hypothetical protein [Bradyrhizobium sp. USDA 329]|uniref:hypothetical protein n=1 Tax=unclassified Bradyrhizobium TaxID=2631580 RepID=UPI00351282D0
MAKAKKSGKPPTPSTRADERKAMLIYMKPAIIDAVKEAAQAGDEKAWQFVERAVKKALKWKGP